MRVEYRSAIESVEAAGLYALPPEQMGSWSRVVVCGEYDDENVGFSGNSFWIALISDRWFLGTWGGSIYEATDFDHLIDSTITWLDRAPSSTHFDLDPEFVQEFSLSQVDEEFAALLNAA